MEFVAVLTASNSSYPDISFPAIKLQPFAGIVFKLHIFKYSFNREGANRIKSLCVIVQRDFILVDKHSSSN
jgi:hypothetical protein